MVHCVPTAVEGKGLNVMRTPTKREAAVIGSNSLPGVLLYKKQTFCVSKPI